MKDKDLLKLLKQNGWKIKRIQGSHHMFLRNKKGGVICMLFIYPAIFYNEGDDYWTEFPDLEGCQTFGSSLGEIVKNSEEALYGYLLTLLEENAAIPSPSDIRNLKTPENGFTSLVSCDINQYKDTKAVKKTLTIPAWLNERANTMGINFSQVLQDALLNKLQHR